MVLDAGIREGVVRVRPRAHGEVHMIHMMGNILAALLDESAEAAMVEGVQAPSVAVEDDCHILGAPEEVHMVAAVHSSELVVDERAEMEGLGSDILGHSGEGAGDKVEDTEVGDAEVDEADKRHEGLGKVLDHGSGDSQDPEGSYPVSDQQRAEAHIS